MRERATHLLALAEKQAAIIPLIMGNRVMGVSLMWTGNITEGRTRFDQAVTLYDHADHPLATRIGTDLLIYTLSNRSLALWILGYPDAALVDARRVVEDARVSGRGLAYALIFTARVLFSCGNYAAANAQIDETIAWADEKSSAIWKTMVMKLKGSLFALTGKASDAVQTITSAVAA